MQLTVFSVHDSKAEAFICPFFSQNSAVGLRMFAQAVNDRAANFFNNAGDYTLFELGTFDQDKGQFTEHDTPINHGLALSFIQAPQRLSQITNMDGSPANLEAVK